MRIIFQGKPYQLSEQAKDELRKALMEIVEDYYDKLGTVEQIAVMGAARALLYKEEKKWGKEIARPPKGTDPVLHLTNMQLKIGLMLTEFLTIELAADDQSNLYIAGIQTPNPGEAGGQLAGAGDQGERQDDVRPGPREAPLPAVS